MAGFPAPPSSAFADVTLDINRIPPGEIWRRMYETRFTDPLGWAPALSRFSDPTGHAFGVVYLGATAKVAFVEALLRDAADGRGPDCVLELAEIEARSLADIEVRETLRLIDLTGDGPMRMGVPSDVAGAQDQIIARRWSLAFHEHPDQPDGVFYPSRLNEQRCIALYGRALHKVETVATPRLIDCAVELAEILENLKIALR